MGFIYSEAAGVLGGSATTAGLAGEAVGHSAQLGAIGGEVLPAGLEEISIANQAKIAEVTAQAAAMLATSSAWQTEYAVSVGMSSAITTLSDALNAATLGAIV